VLSTPPAFVLSQDQTLQTKTPTPTGAGRIQIRETLTKPRHQKLASTKQSHTHDTGRHKRSPKKQQQKQNHQTHY
jgi:hypothetical protein